MTGEHYADIRWGSFLTTPDGEFDPPRARATVAILLALIGGIVLIAAATLELLGHAGEHTANLLYMGGILVGPLTLGKSVDAARGIVDKLRASKIQNGDAPGRRATDAPTATMPIASVPPTD